MQIIKPKVLKRGDVIGIAAPASPPASEQHLVRGIRYLESLGFRIELGKYVQKRRGYLAGTDRERISDLHDLFSNPKVKAIFTIRGGYGCTRILPQLNYRLIRRNPKILVGYSDITALQLALLSKSGLISFSGPMVAVEMAGKLQGEAEEQFWRCLTSSSKPKILQTHDPAKRIVHKGITEGILLGGNLSLVASLVGTEYFPKIKPSILMLEEIEERPYRVNRMLNQLRLAKVFKRTAGVALGEFTGCEPEAGKPSLTLQQVFEDSFQGYNFPVVGHFHNGHVDDLLTI
ncbi:MAG: LD-carboxypeptidase, partial [Ignavibacteriales bacterium]|nr:LD-carboxypeptidase [Ignavibacteriales bacterium]